jgi:capsular exopolysaccharide synthesis family protein
MSEFFRALERAERERAARRTAPPAAPEAASARSEDSIDVASVRSHDTPVAIADDAATAVAAPPVEAPVAAPPMITIAPPVEAPRPAKPLTIEPARGTGEVDEHLVSLITPDTFEADQYRVLRHTVEQRRRAAGLAIVGVTSAGPGDGKTTTAINLAGALAQDRGARVLLVDCDLRSSAMARRLGLAEGRGLVQAIVDPLLTLDDAVRHLPRFNLDVMPAGFETASPYELLKSPRLGDLFETARRRYDYVVVDTPPVLPFPDCRVLSKVVDGFLLVVSAHRTPRGLVDESLEVLPRETVLGVVFNGDSQPMERSLQGYYGEDGRAEANGGWRSSARRAWARVGGA